MSMQIELNDKSKEFIDKKVAEHIIKVYLAIKDIKDNDNLNYQKIYEKHRVNILKYEKLYEMLNSNLKLECEKEIKKDIKAGKLNLDMYLAKLYKEYKEPKNDGEER